ncbi:hypothetical protein JB92DRAFT_57372 [Gautieria morchelliformis]|nr:hypothetical protein JB92DRAFT_57372 [Gautieria morchelliformis]
MASRFRSVTPRRCLWLLFFYLCIATKYVSYSLTFRCIPSQPAVHDLTLAYALSLPPTSNHPLHSQPLVLMNIAVIRELFVVSPLKPPVASPMKRKNIRDSSSTSPKKQMRV